MNFINSYIGYFDILHLLFITIQLYRFQNIIILILLLKCKSEVLECMIHIRSRSFKS